MSKFGIHFFSTHEKIFVSPLEFASESGRVQVTLLFARIFIQFIGESITKADVRKSYSWNYQFRIKRGSVLVPDKLTLQHRDELDMTEKKSGKSNDWLKWYLTKLAFS